MLDRRKRLIKRPGTKGEGEALKISVAVRIWIGKITARIGFNIKWIGNYQSQPLSTAYYRTLPPQRPSIRARSALTRGGHVRANCDLLVQLVQWSEPNLVHYYNCLLY